MHRARIGLVIGAVIAATAFSPAPAQAQAAPKPYRPVGLTLPAPVADPSFDSFRAELAQVLPRRVFAELSRFVVARGFFWDGDFDNEFDPRRSGTENLAGAVKLEQGGGAGWERLVAFAGETSAAPLPSRPGVICAPANPTFDEIEFDRMLDVTGTVTLDWVYPHAAGVEARQAAAAASPVVERLGLNFVRLVPGNVPATDGGGWVRVATPGGKLAFAPAQRLRSLRAERLCYVKDVAGRWHIAGYVGHGR